MGKPKTGRKQTPQTENQKGWGKIKISICGSDAPNWMLL